MRKQSTKCTFCPSTAAHVLTEDMEFLSDSTKQVYLCKNCYKTFNTGSILGQVQLNNKMINLILSFDDDDQIVNLKQKLINYSPSSKDKLFQNKPSNTLSPRDLYNFLSEYVIGQDYAKKRIALSAFEHMKSLKSSNEDKQNILLLGPSGSGKTLIVNSLSKCLDLPYVLSDSTAISPTGFQGADSDSVVLDLLYKTDNDIDEAEKGIVFLDEIDKLANRHSSGTKLESFNYATQSTLLKLIEGRRVRIPNSFLTESMPSRYIDTSKIMFCLGGAFNGLEKIVAKKLGHTDNLIGFRNKQDQDYSEMMKTFEVYAKASHDILVESLIEYGMATELIGRIQTIAPLAPLTKDELMSCLNNLDNSPIKRNKILFAESGIELDFAEEFLDAVCDQALKTGTGTRALFSIVKSSVSSAAFDYLGTSDKIKRIIITKECLEEPKKFVAL